jgi:predicted membrane channel-forming protein YqfA (hemolysin III family)
VYSSIVIVYAISRWFFGSGLGINLDLFGVSISLWIISEILYRFWTPFLRWISGLLGFVVAAIFGIMPTEIFLNLHEYWWIILFWLPAVLSYRAPNNKRTYSPWFFAGMLTYLLAFVIWLQGYPNTPYCNPDSFIQPHAIWHLVTALSTWCFFKFLRTEEKIKNI